MKWFHMDLKEEFRQTLENKGIAILPSHHVARTLSWDDRAKLLFLYLGGTFRNIVF